jgi:aryl-alcohol dehydrogenase-like predicted oxidoreductase
MEYREIGNTGIKVSVIGLGSWPMGGLVGGVIGETKKVQKAGWSGAVDEESIRTIRKAEELGINFVHSSEIYGGGHAEAIIGQALIDRRDRFVIATKVRPVMEGTNPDAARRRIREALEGSLRRLQTDYVDIHQLHSFPNENTTSAVMDEYEKLKQEGKVRHVAISATDPDRISDLRAHGEIVAMMFGYNMLSPAKPQAFELAQQENLGTVILSSLASGILSGKWFGKVPDIDPMDKRYASFTSPEAVAALEKLKELEFLTHDDSRTMAQAAFRFILDTPGVTSILTGALRPSEIEENVGALDTPPLTDDELSRIGEITAAANEIWRGG